MSPDTLSTAALCLQKLRFYSEEGFKGKHESRADRQFIRENAVSLAELPGPALFPWLKAILCGPYIMDIMLEFPDAFCAMLPELAPMIHFDGRSAFRIFDIWGHTTHSVAAIRPHAPLRLAMLFHDAAKPQCFTIDKAGRGHFYGHPEAGAQLAREVLVRLGCDEGESRLIAHLVRYHDERPPMSAAAMDAYFDLLGVGNIPLFLEVKMADTVSHVNIVPLINSDVFTQAAYRV